MERIGERFSPDIAVLPIGGHYTMDPVDAGRALDLVGAGTAIPVHYGTFPVLSGTPDQLADETDAEVVVLNPGETWQPD